MSEVNWSEFKCRCSAIHMILANSKSNPCLTEKMMVELSELEARDTLTPKQSERWAELLVKKANGSKIILSDTAISYLMEEYSWKTQGMVRVTKELVDIPQMQKGTLVEPDSLRLLSLVDGVTYNPNRDENGKRERVNNEFLSGEVDAYVGESIMTATRIPDIKSIWDYPTFLCKIHEDLTKGNDLQVKGYLDITGAREGEIANCLINTPEHIINGLKWKLLNKTDGATEENPEFKEKWSILERSMYFDSIPVHQRVFRKSVEPMTKEQQTILYDRVKVCREWLYNFDEQYSNLNL